MRMDFDRSVPLPEQRLRVALAKPKRRHPKRHRTNDHREKATQKRAMARRRNKVKLDQIRRWKNRVAAYWRGELEEYPHHPRRR